eukprot:scaffold388765_cov15-Prasinocladus_malaysianus.AAC.1
MQRRQYLLLISPEINAKLPVSTITFICHMSDSGRLIVMMECGLLFEAAGYSNAAWSHHG